MNEEQKSAVLRSAAHCAMDMGKTWSAHAAYQQGAQEGFDMAHDDLGKKVIELEQEIFEARVKLQQSTENTQAVIDTIKRADEVESEMMEHMKAENAHLREIIKGKEIDAKLYINEIQRLEAENANLKRDNERLETWQREAVELYGPVDDYMREHGDVFGIDPGDSIQDRVLEVLMKYRKLIS